MSGVVPVVLTPQPEVWVGEQAIAQVQAAAALRQVTVVTELDVPGMFTLELTNRNVMPGETLWSDAPLFDLGTRVAIKMGDRPADMLIDGEITGLEPEFAEDDVPTLVVRGYDRRHRLMRGQKTRSFVQMKDSDIVDQIAREAGLKRDITTTEITLEYVLQQNQTDLDFLQSRARRIGYELIMQGKTLVFQPAPQTGSAAITLAYPDDLDRFSPRLSSLNQVEKVEVRGWDMRQKKPVVSRSRTAEQPTGMGQTRGSLEAWQTFGRASQVHVETPVTNPAEAAQMAEGEFRQMALGYITGDGQCTGQARLSAGQMVAVQGVGDRFGGLYYVTAATHTFGPHQPYRTEFSVKRNAHYPQENNR